MRKQYKIILLQIHEAMYKYTLLNDLDELIWLVILWEKFKNNFKFIREQIRKLM